MQQRVGLARARAANPDMLLMGEPFSARDPLIRRQFQDAFMRLPQILKKSTIFISRNLDEAVRIADRIATMRGQPIRVENQGQDVGVITRAKILRTVAQGTEMS